MSPDTLKSVRRSFGIAGAIIMCAIGIKQTAQIGLGRALTAAGSIGSLDRAIRISPYDPQGYKERARLRLARGEYELAIADLRQANRLRTDDYESWIMLGQSLDHTGDTTRALSAMLEARRLAPGYVSVNWLTGTVLLKAGRRDEAFKEFRAAASRQPTLFSQTIQLAWESYGKDATAVEKAVSPVNLRERIALTEFFLRNGDAAAATVLIKDRSGLTGDDRRQLTKAFFNAQAFSEAFEMWSESTGERDSDRSGGVVYDGGFENGRFTGDSTFDWSFNHTTATKALYDQSEKRSGNYSLRLDWTGNKSSNQDVLTQVLIVDPQTRYQLNFAVKTLNLVTIAAPNITVYEVGKEDRRLARSAPLPAGTSNWEAHSVQFTTTEATRAVRVALRLEDCPQESCAIVGSLWLDDFSLQVLRNQDTLLPRGATNSSSK
ncbi:MAG TPA: carbohydrate binding domain-containing protein [Pyrinomonadaceae bacterium]|nr:carbohydrate binding domain-containing protein [Pyrinomonadaceae bacterium]